MCLAVCTDHGMVSWLRRCDGGIVLSLLGPSCTVLVMLMCLKCVNGILGVYMSMTRLLFIVLCYDVHRFRKKM